MIRRLRARQRLLVPLVALISVPLVLAGLLVRGPDPEIELPPALAGRRAPDAAPDLDQDAGFADLAVHAHVWRDVADAPGPVLELTPARDPRRPDLLVYWSQGQTPEPLAAPADEALFLGRLSGTSPRVLALPERAGRTAGSLLLYSLAHGELVDRAAWPLGPEAP